MRLGFTSILVSISIPCRADIRFVSFGDMGANSPELADVTACVGKYAARRDFSILLGDNFYPNGVSSVDDPQFALFRDVVAKDTTRPHYVVLGNHDYMQNVHAQIEYSKVDPRWLMPSSYYQWTFEDGDTIICAYFVDTMNLDPAQLAWLDKALSSDDCRDNAGWRIVSGHYPIWSAGFYGDVLSTKTSLLPILKAHNVALYLSAHDHVHQVFFDGEMVEIVTGASSQLREALDFAPHEYLVWAVSGTDIHGYADIRVRRDSIHISMIAAKNGRSFISFTKTRNGTRQSIFGHIDWTPTNSNAFAPMVKLSAAPVTPTPKEIETSLIVPTTTTKSTERPGLFILLLATVIICHL